MAVGIKFRTPLTIVGASSIKKMAVGIKFRTSLTIFEQTKLKSDLGKMTHFRLIWTPHQVHTNSTPVPHQVHTTSGAKFGRPDAKFPVFFKDLRRKFAFWLRKFARSYPKKNIHTKTTPIPHQDHTTHTGRFGNDHYVLGIIFDINSL